ncbi:xanthine dehydrogenase accessory protein XdhC [soil metagenome]
MTRAIDDAIDELARGHAVVRVTIVATRGSTPRDADAECWVGESALFGSIGGGHLEFRALEIARGMLAGDDEASARHEHMVLGATLGQCCGGVVDLWFERWCAHDLAWLARRSAAEHAARRSAIWTCLEGGAARRGMEPATLAPALAEAWRSSLDDGRFRRVDHDGLHWFIEPFGAALRPLWLYGAGHVARALVPMLEPLPYDIHWIDNRETFAEGAVAWSDAPEADALTAPADAIHLVMTHDHDLDLRIVEAILMRPDFAGSNAFCGLIGSKTKAARFRHRLADRGLAPSTIERLACPLGAHGIASKLPAAVAIAIAAQLLTLEPVSSRQRQPAPSSASA